MINPCGDSFDLVLPHSVGNSTKKSSESSTENAKWEGANGWRNKRPSRVEEEEMMEKEMEELDKCCWGRMGTKSALLLFVLLNFGFDLLCAYLSLEHSFVSYIFAGCSLISFMTICAVLNGIQKEQKTMIKMSAIYAGIKAVVLLALTLTALAGLIEEHLANAQFRPSLRVNLLFCLLPLFVVSLSFQYQISQRVVRLFRLRDQFYVISAANLPIEGLELGWKKIQKEELNGGKI